METRCGKCSEPFESEELEEDYKKFYKDKILEPIEEWYQCDKCKEHNPQAK